MSQNPHHIGQLTPASNVEIAEALKVLFNSLPFQRGTDPATAVMAYCEALRGASVDAIRAGVSKFLRGECEGVSSKFTPTPPELARIVRTATVVQRLPQIEHRRRDAASMDDKAKARMRLKMPMLNHAWGNAVLMAELDRANKNGLDEMVILAMKWGIAIPDELNGQTDAEWRVARNRAWGEVERSPTVGMIQHRKALAEHSHLPVIAENVSYEDWRRMSAQRQVPVGAMWVASLGTVYGPKQARAAA